MQTTPIVRLEVEHMKLAILHAFSQRQIEVDAMVKAAIDEACKPAALQNLIDTTTRNVINEAVKREVQEFFSRFGNGGKAIRAAVTEYLDLVYPENDE